MIINKRGHQRPATYRKQFERDETEKLEITDSDIALFRQLEKHRFLRTDHVIELVFNSTYAQTRLRQLTKAGFIDRPERQLVRFRKGGRRPMVYALGVKGAGVLRRELLHYLIRKGVDHDTAEREARRQYSRDWAHQNKQVMTEFIEHTLEIADFMVPLECLLRTHPVFELIEEAQLVALSPQETQARKAHVRTKWAAEVRWDAQSTPEEMAAVPDAIFRVQRRDGSKIGNCVLEIDTGSMPVERSDKKLSSIKRKALVYLKAYRDGYQQNTFNWKSCRFLFVTATPERAATILACIEQVCGGKNGNAFWVTDWTTIKAGTLLDVPWRLGSGEVGYLLRE